jgi:hypothetical protein
MPDFQDCEELARHEIILNINGRDVMQICNALALLQQFLKYQANQEGVAVCDDCSGSVKRLSRDFEDQLDNLKDLIKED